MNPDKVVCKNNIEIITATFQLLGFTVNEKKSVLIPRQKIIFFGFIIDSVEFKVYLTEEKLQKLLLRVTYLLNTRVIKVRELASVIGLIVSCFHAVLEVPLHYRSLERDKICGLGSSMNYENMVDLSKASCLDLTWWTKNIREKNGKSVRPNQVEHYCRCDASLCGWGSIENTYKHANGRWSAKEAKLSINILELLAIYYSLQLFYSDLVYTHIQVESHNVSAIKYLNDMGGMTCNTMDSIAKNIWEWCVERSLFVSAVHVPGVKNIADFFSRVSNDNGGSFWFPCQITQTQRLTDTSTRLDQTSLSKKNHYRRCSYIKEFLEGQSLLRQTANVIISSWRPGIRKQYELPWRKRYFWCLFRKISQFVTSEVIVVNSYSYNHWGYSHYR